MRKLYLFVLLLVFMIYAGCKKDDRRYTYPDGESFDATIGSMQLKPCNYIVYSTDDPIHASFVSIGANHHRITVSGTNTCDASYTYGRWLLVRFDSVAIAENTTYKFAFAGVKKSNQVTLTYSEELSLYYSDSSLPGSITIHSFDPVGKTMSASFDATLKKKNGSALINVSNGNFNVRVN